MNKSIVIHPMERNISKLNQGQFFKDTGTKFEYCQDDKFYCMSLRSDNELLTTFKEYYRKYANTEPWSGILNKDFFKESPETIFRQKFYCDGTFLREENALKRSSENRTRHDGYRGPFYQCELLILYLSGVDRISMLQRKEELKIVDDFLAVNRRSFRGEKRFLHQEEGQKRREETLQRYNLYFKPIFQKISSFIKKRGSNTTFY